MYQVLRLRIYHKHNTKLNKLASAGEELGLHSQTLQVIGETHAKARKQAKKNKLRWRTNRKDAKFSSQSRSKTCTATGEIGIDYGCKTAATCSNGDKLETKFTQQYAKNLLPRNGRIRKSK